MSVSAFRYLSVGFGIVAVMLAAYGLHISYSALQWLEVPGAETRNLLSIVLIFRGCSWILVGVISAIFCSTLARMGEKQS